MVSRLLALTLLAFIGLGAGLYVVEGRSLGPAIDIIQPTRLVGRSAIFEATVTAPGGELTRLDAVIEQAGQQFPLFSLDRPLEGQIRQDGPDRIRITRRFNRSTHNELANGSARVVVSASRPTLFKLREISGTAALDVNVRLDPPRIEIVSTLHYLNHGGSEMIVYRITPPDAHSAVRVGSRLYHGYPATGAGLQGDDMLRVAFFALLHDQDLRTPVELYAIDEAGNETITTFDFKIFPKSFKRSLIHVSDGFLRRVVPPIVSRTADLANEELTSEPTIKELTDLYLFINGTLRKRNRDTLAAFAGGTSAALQWEGPFAQMANSQVESGFGDHRTYIHRGTEVDQQVHLGFDLASNVNAPVLAANKGTVLHADYLGIYGNCVIVDHGMGLQSLYAHLSTIDVSAGQAVEQAQRLGLSGHTGLAGGDHLHFAMLLQGQPVTPVEWWDPHWIKDRIQRKLQAASVLADERRSRFDRD